jgi:hypothetical protein
MINTPQAEPTYAAGSTANLALYELQRPFVEPVLRCFRFANTLLDTLFYDVGVLATALMARGIKINADEPSNLSSSRHPLAILDLTAQTNPSGAVIIVDPNLPPVVREPFLDMKEFFEFANSAEGSTIHTLTVTGVGSSALGSVAMAWDAAVALQEPVAAIVPGYGLADVVAQALGGWYGFELYDALQRTTQDFLANFAPTLAMMGKDLALSTPGRQTAATGAPVFRHGSAASDDVHAILHAVPGIIRLIGHSKGALAIENALRSLSPARTKTITVYTFGCAISEEVHCKSYAQYLGCIDALGIWNSMGNFPEHWPFADQSTNTLIPFSLEVGKITNRAV